MIHPSLTHPVNIDVNKKVDPKQKTIQIFNIEAQRFRKRKDENPLMQEIGVGGGSANHGLISWHWLAGNSNFLRGMFFTSCFSEP